ncbi:PrgI family protein [Patescibacteria group bacterium]|nr:PrgI family protein [Patescibacteria group bacterium]
MPERYVVPQFIDNEDKILGPITVRQFLILLVSTVLLFITYAIFTLPVFIVIALFICGIAGAFGFLKIHTQPFHLFFLNFLASRLRPHLRVWDKNLTDEQLRVFMNLDTVKVSEIEVDAKKQRPTSSRLRDLTLVVNTGGVYKPDDDPSF